MRYTRPDWRRRREQARRRWSRPQSDSAATAKPNVPSEVVVTREVTGLRNFFVSLIRPIPTEPEEPTLTDEDIREARREKVAEERREKRRKKKRKKSPSRSDPGREEAERPAEPAEAKPRDLVVSSSNRWAESDKRLKDWKPIDESNYRYYDIWPSEWLNSR